MPTVVGLKFENDGAMHFYTPGAIALALGDIVLAETATGAQLAHVVFGPREMANDQVPVALRPVMRLATPDDKTQAERNRALLARAATVVPQKISQLALPMKLIEIEAQPDGGRITVFFAADGRIDFRELVRELVMALGVRVLMHQVGARDHAKMLGGIGSCGREICCSAWMPVFEPVSMRMAKEQSLFLNPSKFSGNCGKLKCCLRYEYDFYAETHDFSPVVGAECDTPHGPGRVVDVNVVKGVFTVEVPQVGRVEMGLRLSIEPVGCAHGDGVCDGCPLLAANGKGACAGCEHRF